MNKYQPRMLCRARRQRGVSLIAVLALLLLSLMAVMGAIRVSNLNESLLGSSTDYNRTYAAAEAMMNDAEMDIRGRRPPFTTIQADGNYGMPCRSNSATGTVTTACYLGCRQLSGPLASACAVPVASINPFIPEGGVDFDEVDRRVAANTNANFAATRRCMEGICIPLNTTDLANIENNLAQMTPLGATYGQFTRANAYDAAPGVLGNPILTANPARAWYWIEVFRYQKTICGSIGTCTSNVNAPDALQPYVFRITAIAQGLKLDTSGNPTTRVVLKSIFVPSIDPP
jgi:type IV pilus assembly protein PilX